MRPMVILITYFMALAVITVLAGFDSRVPAKARHRIRQPSLQISVAAFAVDTATVDETVTCEIDVSSKNREATATLINVTDNLVAYAGASLDVIGAKPSFENTEAVPFGGGLKVNWGKFQIVGGEKLSFKLYLKSKRKGTITGIASAKLQRGGAVTSNNLSTMFFPAVSTIATSAAGKASTTLPSLGGLSGTGPSTGSTTPGTSRSSASGSSSTGTSLSGQSTGSSTSSTTLGNSAWTTTPATSTQLPPATFRDVKNTDWFAKYVKEVTSWGLMGGFHDGTFKPANNLTRAEFVMCIVRGTGPAPGSTEPFSDVGPTDWFYQAVVSAYNLGLIDGAPGAVFAPFEKTAREDAVIIGVRATGVPVDTSTETIDKWLQGFPDRAAISERARPYVAASVRYGLPWRYTDGKFYPASPVTRAETAALLHWLFFEKHAVLDKPPEYVRSSIDATAATDTNTATATDTITTATAIETASP
ncbi:MAG TPA: S-layer homology domain-containing protein [Candidatus Aquicultor sp.]